MFIVRPTINIYNSLDALVQAAGLCEKDLVVTNAYIVKPYLEQLSAAGGMLYTEQYGTTEPTTDMIDAMLADIRGRGYTRVIAIGGGAVMDISKQLLFREDLSCEDLYAHKEELESLKIRSLVAVPTTCGTGSEVSSISVALFERQKTKIGLVSPALFPNEAALVPSMLESLPYDVFAASSLDALIHAVESFVSPKADAFSKMCSVEGIRRILGGYRKITTKQAQVNDLLETFSVASCIAGIAFANAGCGGVHALSFPLGGSFHVPHGKANYYLFLTIFAKYVEQGAAMPELAKLLCEELETDDPWGALKALLEQVLPRVPLSQLGVTEADIEQFIPSVIQNQQRLLVNMPVALTEQHMREIYLSCL